jgi:hypothetical protein
MQFWRRRGDKFGVLGWTRPAGLLAPASPRTDALDIRLRAHAGQGQGVFQSEGDDIRLRSLEDGGQSQCRGPLYIGWQGYVHRPAGKRPSLE